jgi:hypothetical protein
MLCESKLFLRCAGQIEWLYWHASQVGSEYLCDPACIRSDAGPQMHALGQRTHAHAPLRLGGSAD